ncbi:5922_t:CDS:2, partial [Acaulospora colombiana]
TRKLIRPAVTATSFVSSSAIGASVSTRAMSDSTVPVQKSEEEWRAILNPEQFRILRQKGTERPGTGEYEHTKDTGIINLNVVLLRVQRSSLPIYYEILKWMR